MDIKTLLERGAAEIIDQKHLEQQLKSGKKLRVKLGIDPTGEDLHIGHAVPLLKLKEFQDAGHKAVFIVGDFTAMIGDPSGKDKTRRGLSFTETRKNAKAYFAQAFKILDRKKTEVHYNSEWLSKLDFQTIVEMLSKSSVEQLLAHETFRRRVKKREPFFAHELLYPILQGYDSVMVKADVELGASEQKFNLLTGRRLQKLYGQKQQDIVIVPYLVGLDGKEKMGKSLGNYVALTDSAEEMFGKVMSIPDKLIMHYFELCTEVAENEIARIKKQHPKEQKVHLAKEIVKIYHGAKGAERAEREFGRKFGRQARRSLGEGGKSIKADFELKKKPGRYSIVELLVAGKLASSKSEARRKIAEGAVEVDGERINDETVKIKIAKGTLLRLGKRFLRIV